MKYKTMLVVIYLGLLTLLSGCATNPDRDDHHGHARIPPNTVGSFNFVKGPDGHFKLVIIGKDGKVVEPSTKHGMKDRLAGKKLKMPKNEVRMYFKNGSCIVYVCLPGVPCRPVVIDPVNNCPAF